MTISNNEIKRIKSLQQKKFRDESGLFIVEGEKMVEEALKSGFAVEAVYRKDEIGENAMARISSLASPSPVLAVVKKPSDHIIDDVTVLSPPSGILAIWERFSELPTGSASMQSLQRMIRLTYSIRKSSRLPWAPYSA